jgi:hypothetical protein
MDASPMSTTSRRIRHPLPHLSAVIVVIAVHGSIALWLLQPAPLARPDDEVRTSLRWLARPPLPPAAAQPAASVASNSTPATSSRSRRSPSQQQQAVAPQSAAPAQQPLNLAISDAAVGGTAVTADTFAPQAFRRLNEDPAFQHRPRYFRLKPQMSPRQMIQGVASYLGFWPPGYEIDPCSLSRSDVNYFQNAVNERDRDALRSALLQESAHCRR